MQQKMTELIMLTMTPAHLIFDFFQNREQEKMAMTTPVISANPFSSEAGVARKMSFIMPSRFWGLQEGAQGQDGDGATSEASAAGVRPPTPLDGKLARIRRCIGVSGKRKYHRRNIVMS